MRKVLLLLPLLLLASGCDEPDRSAFGGLIGTVGYPPVANCDVEIYDAVSFVGLHSTTGRIAATRTDGGGRFSLEFDDGYLGHTLLVVARPGPTAMYRDFGAVGTPDVAFDDPRQPWVAVVNEWLGGSSTVTVNPLTTVAFECLLRLPDSETGGADHRFDRRLVDKVNAATAAAFGLKSDIARELPAAPGGALFVPLAARKQEQSDRCSAYTYAGLQLAKAANDFCATSAGTDSALDFYEALFVDARDGVLDGMHFGTAEVFLNQVPAVVGRDVDGESRLMQYVAAHALTATEEGYAGAARGGAFDPPVADMLALQDESTGTLRPTRIDSYDVQNFPYSGNVLLTIKGAGLRRTDALVLRSYDDANAEFTVTRTSVNVDGEFQYHSDSELQVRLPDFGATTLPVAANLQVAAGANFRRLRMIVENRPELAAGARDVEYLLTDDLRVTNRTEPLLVHATVGRVDASGFRATTGGNNVYGAVDPAGLNPATQDVYELRLRVANPAADAVNNMALSLPDSTFTQLGAAVVADIFGGSAANRALVLDLPTLSLNPGDVVQFNCRFTVLDTAVPADIDLGPPVVIRPVLSGTSAGAGNPTVTTDDITDFTRTVSFAPVAADPTAGLTSLALTAPVSVTAGNSFDLELDLTAAPRAGVAQRDLRVDFVDLTITFDGNTTLLRLNDAFWRSQGASDLVFAALVNDATGGRGFPLVLTATNAAGKLVLTISTGATRTGTLSVAATAQATDLPTGTTSTAADSVNVSVNP